MRSLRVVRGVLEGLRLQLDASLRLQQRLAEILLIQRLIMLRQLRWRRVAR